MTKELGIPSTSILDVDISALTYKKALDIIAAWIKNADHAYVCVANVHMIMECQRNALLKHVVNEAQITTPDGMPLVWLSRLAGQSQVERVYGPSLMLQLCEQADENQYRIFLLGGLSGTSGNVQSSLTQRYPGLSIVGALDTPDRPPTVAQNEQIIAAINNSKADIVFVGIGCPYQELWMGEYRDRVTAPVMIGVGAAFDFISGRIRQAPAWMQRSGLEWLFRLSQDPKKLAGRYLVNNPLFVAKIVTQVFSGKFRRVH